MIKATLMFTLPGTITIHRMVNYIVETSKNAKKTNNLRKNKNVYFCIDKPNPHTKEFVEKELSTFMKT